MELLVGIVLAISVSLFAAIVGLDRDRAFYPAVLAVVASYYALFSVMGGSVRALLAESVAIALFLGATALGFRRNLWIVVAGLAAHGVYDFFHGRLVSNPGVPAWWPTFCLAYDVTAAACLGWLLRHSRVAAAAR